MTTRQAPFQPAVDEIADGIYRISTLIPDVSPEGFTFNQFLVVGDEPLLFHTGMRGLFPLVSEAVATVVPVASLRWISFGHLEADESGSMNMCRPRVLPIPCSRRRGHRCRRGLSMLWRQALQR